MGQAVSQAVLSWALGGAFPMAMVKHVLGQAVSQAKHVLGQALGATFPMAAMGNVVMGQALGAAAVVAVVVLSWALGGTGQVLS